MNFNHCDFLSPKERRIALYDPSNEFVFAAYPTLEEAMKDFDIPADIEFEQGAGQLFIAVPLTARKAWRA